MKHRRPSLFLALLVAWPAVLVSGATALAQQPPTAFAEIDPGELSTGVRTVLGLSEGYVHPRERHRAIERLPKALSERDREAIEAYVRVPKAPPTIRASVWRACVNDLLVALKERADTPGDIRAHAALLRELWQTPERDPVIREYALQHMGLLHGRCDPPTAAKLVATLGAAAAAAADPAAGAAVIALVELAGDPPAREALEQSVRAILVPAAARRGVPVPEGNVAAAFNAAGVLGASWAAEPARSIAADPDAPTLARASAIAALGGLGDPAVDVALLAELSARAAPESVTRQAARAAMERLSPN